MSGMVDVMFVGLSAKTDRDGKTLDPLCSSTNEEG